jgi:beta-galactosidase beta subunit
MYHLVIIRKTKSFSKANGKGELCKVSIVKMRRILKPNLELRIHGSKIELPGNMLYLIFKYMKYPEHKTTINGEHKYFDCYCFVKYLNGMKYASKEKEQPDNNDKDNGYLTEWDESTVVEEGLLPGDSVAMKETSGEKRSLHFAVYIGCGMYVSKFGSKGDVGITTWKEMQRAYGEHLVMMKLQRKPVRSMDALD